jgi:hypothetical protein
MKPTSARIAVHLLTRRSDQICDPIARFQLVDLLRNVPDGSLTGLTSTVQPAGVCLGACREPPF